MKPTDRDLRDYLRIRERHDPALPTENRNLPVPLSVDRETMRAVFEAGRKARQEAQ